MSKKKAKITRFAPKLNIKKGDRVVVISGRDKDRSKSFEVLEVLPEKQRVIVDQINIVKKHVKPSQDNPGGIIEIPAPIHISNVMLADPKSGEPTRIGRKEDSNGNRVRYSKKSGETF